MVGHYIIYYIDYGTKYESNENIIFEIVAVISIVYDIVHIFLESIHEMISD